MDNGEGGEEGDPPEGGHFAVMMMPEMGSGQWHDGDGQKHARKRHDPEHAELLADFLGFVMQVSRGERFGQQSEQSQNKEYYILSAAKIALHLNKTVSLDSTFERISLIEPADIQNMATKIFDPKRLSTLKYEQYSKQ